MAMEYSAGSLTFPIYLSRSLHKNQNCITFRSIHFVSTTWFNEFLILKSEFFNWSKDCFDRFQNWNFGIRKTMRWSAYCWLIEFDAVQNCSGSASLKEMVDLWPDASMSSRSELIQTLDNMKCYKSCIYNNYQPV